MVDRRTAHTARLSTAAELRAERGMSLRQLAAATGISNGLLSLMERGLLLPNSEQLRVIVEALAPGAKAYVRFEIVVELPS